ncbi:unnamed protein product [Arctogadus glacialis]
MEAGAWAGTEPPSLQLCGGGHGRRQESPLEDASRNDPKSACGNLRAAQALDQARGKQGVFQLSPNSPCLEFSVQELTSEERVVASWFPLPNLPMACG